MCLLALEYQTIPTAPILVLANREESYSRPGTPPQRVRGDDGQPDWVGGLDPVAGGTWLGVNARGVLVAITNRRKSRLPEYPRSRGLLCRDLLAAESARTACDWAVAALQGDGSPKLDRPGYAGCNFLLVDRESAWVVEAGDHFRVTALTPGLHLITNGELNDSQDLRISRVRRELLRSRPESLAEWRLRGEQICSAPAKGGEPAICLEETHGGTVSASILALGGPLEDAMYWHAAGPPSRTPFVDWTPLLGSLLDSTVKLPQQTKPHRITLRGPWDYELLDAQLGRIAAGTIRLPLAEPNSFPGHPGYVHWMRRFHRPTNLTPTDRVFLVFTGVTGCGTTSLNGTLLGKLAAGAGPQSFDVTGQLNGNEALVIELEPSDTHRPAVEPFSVTLEIYSDMVGGS